jgi:hypothetical protein
MTTDPEVISVRTFCLDSTKSKVLHRNLGLRALILAIALAVFIVVLQWGTWKEVFSLDSVHDHLAALSVVTFSLLILVYIFWKAARKDRESLDSWEIVIGPDFILRRLKNLQDLEIRRDEVTSITEGVRGLAVRTALRERGITVSSSMEAYEDARARLARWRVFDPEKSHRVISPMVWSVAVPLVVILLIGIFVRAGNHWITLTTGLLLLAGMSWSFWRIQKSTVLGPKNKRQAWIIVLPMLAFAGKLLVTILMWNK